MFIMALYSIVTLYCILVYTSVPEIQRDKILNQMQKCSKVVQ